MMDDLLKGGQKVTDRLQQKAGRRPMTEEQRLRRNYRQKMYAEKHREKVREANRKWVKKNPGCRKKARDYERLQTPLAFKARKAIRNAVYFGRLIRPCQCSKCGKQCKTEGHHPDYSKPHDVIWLCFHCHRALHAAEKANG